ncbi:MAG: GNAT family N-acetyltransferase [Oscillospiraceae bacterium]|jgi:GNAT superfamily N-acetyltransferase|nr:GNAT family N-acetyltransferase [Oscillospiraceae bacterium]
MTYEPETLTLTKAAPDDGAEIFALYRSLIGEAGMAAWHDDYPAPENVRDDTASGSLYVAKIDSVIASVCSLGDDADDGFDYSNFDKSVRRWAELSRVGTLRAYQRRGLSATLIRFALGDARMRGYDGVRLFVNELSPVAIAHYAKLGAHYCGRTSAYGHTFLCGEFTGDLGIKETV